MKEGILLLETEHLAGEMLQKVQSCPGITAPHVYRINHQQVLARQNVLPAALMALEFSCMRFSGTSASITCRFLLASSKLWGKKSCFLMHPELVQLMQLSKRVSSDHGPSCDPHKLGVFLGENEHCAAFILEGSILMPALKTGGLVGGGLLGQLGLII